MQNRYPALQQCLILTIAVMIAETVSIGVLSLPAAVSAIGMAPYVQLTPYTRSIYSVLDTGLILFPIDLEPSSLSLVWGLSRHIPAM